MSIRLPNSVFVHIPRTAGTWFQEVVRTLGLKYQALKGDVDSHFTHRELPTYWHQFTSFSFVRHPYHWVKSRWSHALEINACEDHRHYGVHRLFDECVRPTLTATLKELLAAYPTGLVGRTYIEMLDGVDHIFSVASLPDAAAHLLHQLEGLPKAGVWPVVRALPPTNSTTTLSKYQAEFDGVPSSLIMRFQKSEDVAMDIWHDALQNTPVDV